MRLWIVVVQPCHNLVNRRRRRPSTAKPIDGYDMVMYSSNVGAKAPPNSGWGTTDGTSSKGFPYTFVAGINAQGKTVFLCAETADTLTALQ